MFSRILRVHKLSPFSHPKPPPPPVSAASAEEPEDESMALKIVHVGGYIEHYYMATPAATILEKYPSFVLAKPEVFRRPWDSVVRPEKILRPGQKFLLVPVRTVKKLRRRIRKPKKDQVFMGQNEVCEAGSSSSSAWKKKNGVKKHVRFAGVDVKNKKGVVEHGNGGRRDNAQTWQPSLDSISEIHGD